MKRCKPSPQAHIVSAKLTEVSNAERQNITPFLNQCTKSDAETKAYSVISLELQLEELARKLDGVYEQFKMIKPRLTELENENVQLKREKELLKHEINELKNVPDMSEKHDEVRSDVVKGKHIQSFLRETESEQGCSVTEEDLSCSKENDVQTKSDKELLKNNSISQLYAEKMFQSLKEGGVPPHLLETKKELSSFEETLKPSPWADTALMVSILLVLFLFYYYSIPVQLLTISIALVFLSIVTYLTHTPLSRSKGSVLYTNGSVDIKEKLRHARQYDLRLKVLSHSCHFEQALLALWMDKLQTGGTK